MLYKLAAFATPKLLAREESLVLATYRELIYLLKSEKWHAS